MERLSDMNPCNTCTGDRQVGNPYTWQCECERCLKPSQWKDKCVNKLWQYEILQEQGRLLELPCAVGDTVYTIYSDEDGSFIEDPIVEEVSTHRIWIESMYFDHQDIGKTLFLTRAEAEKALKGETE